jgi:hypothetical protein
VASSKSHAHLRTVVHIRVSEQCNVSWTALQLIMVVLEMKKNWVAAAAEAQRDDEIPLWDTGDYSLAEVTPINCSWIGELEHDASQMESRWCWTGWRNHRRQGILFSRANRYWGRKGENVHVRDIWENVHVSDRWRSNA